MSPPVPEDQTVAVDALNQRAWELRFSAPREGLRLAEEARAAAHAADYARGEAYALRNAGGCRCLVQDYEAALDDLRAAERMFDELRDPVGKAAALNWIGNVHLNRGEFSAAFRAQFEALGLQREAGDRDGEGDSLNRIGNIYYGIGDLPQAMEAFTASLRAKEEVGSRFGISNALNNIGNIHGQLREYPKALEYHTRALELKRELGDLTGVAIALSNVGATYELQGEHPRALQHYYEALAFARRVGERRTEVTLLRELGGLHRKMGELARALDYVVEATSVAVTIDAAFEEADARIGTGEVLAALGRTDDAVAELKRALSLAERIGSRRPVYEARLALSQAYEAAGRPAEALRHFKEYHRVEDEVFNAEAERRIQTGIARVEIERSRQETELLRARNDELAAANEEKARLLDVLRSQAEELDRLSREDALTGLSNRRHLDGALALEWERASRFGRELSVLMADVDHFKRVNDELSHATGDAVLREVGRILRYGTRAVDVAGRWGGEEFVVVLVETPPARAAHVAEKLRAAIESHDWLAIDPTLRLTASFGVAGNAEAGSPAALLAAADARLYRAKRAGRNRVVAME